MQAIAAGAKSVNSLTPIFQLPERLLVECLIDLMDMALLALDVHGDGFRLTEFGKRSLELHLTTFGEQLDDADELIFLREDLTGRIGPRRIVWYAREKGDMPPGTVQGNISFGEMERLLLQEFKANKDYQGRHLHSVDSIVPVRDGISFKVTVDKGSISGLPSQWCHLQPLLVAEAQKRGVSYVGVSQRHEPIEDVAWCETSLGESDLLLTASIHESTLLDAINQAQNHLLIVSSHVSEKMLNTLQAPITAAMQRGVRVDVLWGLPSLDEGGEPHGKTTRSWSQAMRKSSGSWGDYLAVNAEPLNSDAKVLVWDMQDGSFQAIVGSYNWLYGLDGSVAQERGSEASVRINDPRLVGSICSTLAGWLDASGQQSSGIPLRWRQIGLHLAQLEASVVEHNEKVSRARVIFDEEHAQMLREGLMNAGQRLLVTSHKLNRSATGDPIHGGGKLEWLALRDRKDGLQFSLVSGRSPKADSWTVADQKRLEELSDGVGGSISLGKGTHARVFVYDDMAVISSYNFLSTTQDKRQLGVMLQSQMAADKLWEAFGAPRGNSGDG
ncbi:MAG: hypothetical protein H6935_08915 [Thiobacillus sp.]|nr:hypothetical protein [Thiobacillus sp.]